MTDSTMVERCANAMQASPAWPAVFDAVSAQVLARAAIEAMMEPDQRTIEAGRAEIQWYDPDRDSASDTFVAAWQSALRSSLKGEGE